MTPTGAGEDALIEALTARLPLGAATLLGPGDDSAVLAAPDGRFTATTDILVEGVHFRDAWSSGFDVGWRLAAQNLADAAAMGGVPTCLVVALAGPPERLGGQWGVAFAEGLAAYCDRWGVGVAGGDLSSAPLLVACGTAFGDLAGREPVTRSGARPGDVVALSDVVASPGIAPSGAVFESTQANRATDAARAARVARSAPPGGAQTALGASAAGLAWLRATDRQAGRARKPGGAAGRGGPRADGGLGPELAARLEALAETAVSAYRRPDPPLDLGERAALGGARAMLDISDGLAKDAGRLGRASAVRLVVDLASPVLAAAIDTWSPLAEVLAADPREWVAGGGEDHAFLAAFPAGARLPDGWHGIGRVVAAGETGPGATVLGAPAGPPGWDHFAVPG